jgi:hypothetical protein
MIVIRDIVKGAMKKLSVLPMGRDPTAAQGEDALLQLQDLYRELVGLGVFGRLNDVLVQTDTYDANENERVVCDNPTGVTVALPEIITSNGSNALPPYDPCACDYGRGSCETLPRPPRDGTAIVVVDVFSDCEEYYVYDANRAFWVRLDGLTLDDKAPLANRYANGLMAKLALRLASSFGRQPTPLLIGEVNSFHYEISHKADRSRRPVVAEYF